MGASRLDISSQSARDLAPIVGTDLVNGFRLMPDGQYHVVTETVARFLAGIHTSVPNFPDDFQDASLFFRESDQNLILSYLHRGVSRTISTHINIPQPSGGGGGQTAQQVTAAVTAGVMAGVQAWARAGNTDKIPQLKLNLTELEAWVRRLDLLSGNTETLVSSKAVLFGVESSQAIDLDAGKTRPTTGLTHWNIQGHIVALDNAEFGGQRPRDG